MPTSSTRLTTAKGEKLAQRLSHILALLHQGDDIDKHQLARYFQVDIRTIDRDLGERLSAIAERTADGRWQLTRNARGTIPARHLHNYARMAGIEQLFPDTSLRYLLAQLEAPNHSRTMQVHPVCYEDLHAKSAHFLLLQTAIEKCYTCVFQYKGKARRADAYRLIHKNGVWYLAAEESGQLKNFSVALISALQINKDQRFTPNSAHQDYIDSKEDVWFSLDTTKVLLRIAPDVANFFTRRALLPSQKNRVDADGSLLVSALIDHPLQLLPMVRYWLPHVRILHPPAWHEELLRGLQDAFEKWKLP